MRSRLEAGFAQWWDQERVPLGMFTLQYEGRAFANENGQWLPDFRTPDDRTLIEVKPEGFPTLEDTWEQMHIARSTVPDGQLGLAVGKWVAGTYSFEFWRVCHPANLCSLCEPPPTTEALIEAFLRQAGPSSRGVINREIQRSLADVGSAIATMHKAGKIAQVDTFANNEPVSYMVLVRNPLEGRAALGARARRTES